MSRKRKPKAPAKSRSSAFGNAYAIVLMVALPLAILAAVGGFLLKSRALLWVAAGIGAIVSLPVTVVVILIAAFLCFVIVLLPFAPVIVWWTARAKRKKLSRALAALDAVPAGDETGLKAAMDALRTLSPQGSDKVISRVRNPSYPWRLPLMEFVSLEVMEEIARRPDDPVGPVAWLIALRERHREPPRVRPDVPPEEAEKLWRRALGGADLFALPPELEDRT